jgi:hypothetical protein
MSEIETYIAVEQFFGGGGLFGGAPGLGDKTWGSSYLRSVTFKAISLRTKP